MAKLTKLINRISIADTNKTSTVEIDRITGRPLGRIRKRIALRDLYTCQICKRVTSKFEIDHIVPLFAGGSDSDENRQLLCCECHAVKSLGEAKERGA